MNLEKLIWQQVWEYSRNNGIKLFDADDLFQDCYEIAMQVVKKYDEKKEASLCTFVHTCIKNHLKDIRKYENFRDREEVEEEAYESDDFMITIQNILDKKHFEIFVLHFVENYSHREIAEIKNMNRNEVNKCLQHICHQYQSIVLNPIKNLTLLSQRRNSINTLRDRPRELYSQML